MLKWLITTGWLVFILSCKERSSASTVVPRDTTITPAEAFTQLRLDSTTIENFLSSQVEEDELANRLRSFYNARNYQYAWFDEQGMGEKAVAFWNLHMDNIDSTRTQVDSLLHIRMNDMIDEDTIYSPEVVRQTELQLTRHFFQYVHTAFGGKMAPEEMQWHIPRRKIEPENMLDSFLVADKQQWRPLNSSFHRLHDRLGKYLVMNETGGWKEIEFDRRRIREGQSSGVVKEIKRRLTMSGEYKGDTSELFNNELKQAVILKQRSYGMKDDGIVDQDFIDELNVKLEERIKQMHINLERMRWMPEEQPSRLVANIPEFRLHVYENHEEVLGMNIVVGKAANRSVIFSDELKYVVFSPYWNIPRSITRNEIVPAMNRNSNYLSRNNMEIVEYRNGLPVIRQRPGPGNALGKVKFIFPNRYNIYFHDTPAKSLFEREKRAFSHGCIRLEKPFELAQHLLGDEGWSDGEIRNAMNRSSEKWVPLDEIVPVYIVYFTSWVDENGLLHFRDDVYGHDRRMESHLFN